MARLFFSMFVFIGSWSTYLYAESANLAELAKNTGYLILDLQLEKKVTEIVIERHGSSHASRGTKEVTFGPFEPGRHLTLVTLPKGTYKLTRVSSPHYDLPFWVNYTKNKRMTISVEANKTNYFAQIVLGKKRSSESLDIRVVNRLATSLSQFDQSIKSAIALYPLRYAGPLKDNFYETYLAAQVEVAQ
jgi:hypothetical protein